MIYQTVKEYLEGEPRSRERHLRDRAMVNLLLVKYPSLKDIPKETLIAFSQDFESYTREWRQVTRLNPHLRGRDYDTKKKVEERKLESLGYAQTP